MQRPLVFSQHKKLFVFSPERVVHLLQQHVCFVSQDWNKTFQTLRTFINENLLVWVWGGFSQLMWNRKTDSSVFSGGLGAFRRISVGFVILKEWWRRQDEDWSQRQKHPQWRVAVLPLNFNPVISTASGRQQLLFFFKLPQLPGLHAGSPTWHNKPNHFTFCPVLKENQCVKLPQKIKM